MNNAVLISPVWVGLFVTIILTTLGHIGFFIWWASKVTTTLEFVQKSVEKMQNTQNGYLPKEEYYKDKGVTEKAAAAQWKRLDEIKDESDRQKGDLELLKVYVRQLKEIKGGTG